MGKLLSTRRKHKEIITEPGAVELSQVQRQSYDEDTYTMHSERHVAREQFQFQRGSYDDDMRPESGLTTISKDSAYSERSGARASSNAYDESTLFQHMVNAFQPLIERSVKVMEVVPHLHFIDDIELFRSLDRDNPTKAVATLIDNIRESRDPGRWQTFMEALESCGYKYIVTLLKGKTEEDNTTQKKLLRLFTPNLIRRINPREFIDHLYSKDVIGEQDMEEIRCEQTNRGPTAASLMLLDRVPRKVTDWFEIFVDVLKEFGLDDCVKDIEDVSSASRRTSFSAGLQATAIKKVVEDSGPTITEPRRYGKQTDLNEDSGPATTEPRRYGKQTDLKATTQNMGQQDHINQNLLIQLKRNEEMLTRLDQKLLTDKTSQDMFSKLEHTVLSEIEEIKRFRMDIGPLKHLKSNIESLRRDIATIKDDVAHLKQTKSNVLTNGSLPFQDTTHF